MVVSAPESITTARLLLRRPGRQDADAIFARYASIPEVTRYMSWPRHRSVADTFDFLRFSDAEWEAWGAGPYVMETRDTGELIGSTGLSFETGYRAFTGYILARDCWGKGYASEAVLAIVGVCPSLGVVRLFATCHVDHVASCRVLEKSGFAREGVLSRHTVFPNLDTQRPQDVVSYARVF